MLHRQADVYCLEFAGEDDRFAAAEAGAAATDPTVIGPGVAVATDVDPERVRTLAFTRHASDLLARTTGGIDAAETRLAGASLDGDGTVAVRARDVRGTADIDTRTAERTLGSVLVDAGYTIDLDAPDRELRAVFSDDLVLLGWQVAASVRDYGPRRPTNRPFFQPGGMSPLLARALVNLAVPGKPRTATVVDPMCGTGGILIEAGLIGAVPIGLDAQRRMVAGSRRNLRTYLDDDPTIIQGDAGTLPLRAGAADAVIMDVPYGRQSKIESRDHPTLVDAALADARRIAERAVVVTATPLTDDRLDSLAWDLAARYERPVHRSLTRHVHVLT